MPVDPAAQQLLDVIAQLDGPAITEVEPTVAREQYAALGALAGPGREGPAVTARQIAGIPTVVVTPQAPGPLPVLVWLHGGGWVIGSAERTVPLCRDLAALAGVLVVSVDYRLAPEHPFPAGLDDCTAVAEWVLDHADELGGDPNRVAIGGDSAGGNLAAVLAQEIDGFVHQVLVYPVTDATCSQPSYTENASGYFLEAATMHWFVDHYLAGHDPRDPRVSPLFAPPDALVDLPAATVVTAEFDPLRDEGRAYAARLREAGVAVEELHYEGQIHEFVSLGALMPAGAAAVVDIADRLRAGFAVAGAPSP